MTYQRHDHCSFCGQRYTDRDWPRTCAGCGETAWNNPVPVAVVVQYVGDGVLAIRRSIEPGCGELALPGGYADQGESLREAAERELFEETGVRAPAMSLSFFGETSVPHRNLILTFWAALPVPESKLPSFRPCEEVSERVVLYAPTTLAFSSHTDTLARALRR